MASFRARVISSLMLAFTIATGAASAQTPQQNGVAKGAKDLPALYNMAAYFGRTASACGLPNHFFMGQNPADFPESRTMNMLTYSYLANLTGHEEPLDNKTSELVAALRKAKDKKILIANVDSSDVGYPDELGYTDKVPHAIFRQGASDSDPGILYIYLYSSEKEVIGFINDLAQRDFDVGGKIAVLYDGEYFGSARMQTVLLDKDQTEFRTPLNKRLIHVINPQGCLTGSYPQVDESALPNTQYLPHLFELAVDFSEKARQCGVANSLSGYFYSNNNAPIQYETYKFVSGLMYDFDILHGQTKETVELLDRIKARGIALVAPAYEDTMAKNFPDLALFSANSGTSKPVIYINQIFYGGRSQAMEFLKYLDQNNFDFGGKTVIGYWDSASRSRKFAVVDAEQTSLKTPARGFNIANPGLCKP